MTDGEAAAPWWLDLAAVAAGTLVAAVGLVGLVLAVLGAFSTVLTLVLALPAAAAATSAIVRARGRSNGWHLPSALVALALAALYVLFAGWAPAQHVLINRDPGSYTTTARWLARDGSLEVDAAVGGLEANDPALRFDGLAVYDTGDGRLQFQFNHLTSVVLAVAYDLGGHRAMFRVPALAAGAALLALYCVAVRATRREAHLALPGAQGDVRSTPTVFDERAPERTLLRVPAGYAPVRNGFSLALRTEP